LINQSGQNARPIASFNSMNGNINHTDIGSSDAWKPSANGAHETSHASPDMGMHSKEDVQLHLAACLSLLNGVLEYRKGTRVKGECIF